MFGIVLGLKASRIESKMINLKDDDDVPFALQINKVLYLKQLLMQLLSPWQLLQQNPHVNGSYNLFHDKLVIKLDTFRKIIACNFLINVLILHSKPRTSTIYDLIKDSTHDDAFAET